MVAIAERPAEQNWGSPELGSAPRAVVLPPGSLPVDAVRTAARSYRAGVIGADQLIASVDLHGEALERAIARKAAQHLADFHRTLDRAAVLAGYVSVRLAQLEWLKRFPAGPERKPLPLRCALGPVPQLLDAMRAIELEPRADQLDPQTPRRDGRRGAAPSMAALADAGATVTDVALELGVDRRKAWAFLNGRQQAPTELQPALERLLGAKHAALVLGGIPELPRARALVSPAVKALNAHGASAADVAPLVPAHPSTVMRWLRGTIPPSPKLAGALEQLLGAEASAEVVELIPKRYYQK